MNEPLCRALVQARLSEEDVAARLDVDPKTVRRWLEGRIPHLRHRWALAAMLGRDEADLWPELRPAHSRPGEVRATYPGPDAIPHEVWLDLFGSAEREIGILTEPDMFFRMDQAILMILAKRAQAGLRVRICFANPMEANNSTNDLSLQSNMLVHDEPKIIGSAILQPTKFELLIHDAFQYYSIYSGDDRLIVVQHAYGIAVRKCPAIRLARTRENDIATDYLEAFDRICAEARPLPRSANPHQVAGDA